MDSFNDVFLNGTLLLPWATPMPPEPVASEVPIVSAPQLTLLSWVGSDKKQVAMPADIAKTWAENETFGDQFNDPFHDYWHVQVHVTTRLMLMWDRSRGRPWGGDRPSRPLELVVAIPPVKKFADVLLVVQIYQFTISIC